MKLIKRLTYSLRITEKELFLIRLMAKYRQNVADALVLADAKVNADTRNDIINLLEPLEDKWISSKL